MSKGALEMAEEPEIKLPTCWIIEKEREFQKKIYLCLIYYVKAFDYMDHNILWKALKIWQYQTILPVS